MKGGPCEAGAGSRYIYCLNYGQDERIDRRDHINIYSTISRAGAAGRSPAEVVVPPARSQLERGVAGRQRPHRRDWGEYGFYDAFNETVNWFDYQYLAIDQGPIAVMIENYRSGLLWRLFMSCPEIKSGLKKLGFTSPAI